MIQAQILVTRQKGFCPERNTFQYWLQSRRRGWQCVGFPDLSCRFSANDRDRIQVASNNLETVVSECIAKMSRRQCPRFPHARRSFPLASGRYEQCRCAADS